MSTYYQLKSLKTLQMESTEVSRRRVGMKECSYLRRDIFLRESCPSTGNEKIDGVLAISPYGDGPLYVQSIISHDTRVFR